MASEEADLTEGIMRLSLTDSAESLLEINNLTTFDLQSPVNPKNVTNFLDLLGDGEVCTAEIGWAPFQAIPVYSRTHYQFIKVDRERFDRRFLNVAVALNKLGFDVPGSVAGQPSDAIMQKAWELYQPMFQYTPFTPSWEELMSAQDDAIFEAQRSERIALVKRQAAELIELACTDDLGLVTLTPTPEQQAECDRIRTRAAELVAAAEAATTEDQLLEIDLHQASRAPESEEERDTP